MAKHRRKSAPGSAKMPRLPDNATLTKRPLLRPPIPSPYTAATSQKVIYVSAKTPFMSAIKRCEKLLKLSDKRDIQSAKTLVRQENSGRKRKRGAQDAEGEIDAVAEMAERQKRRKVLAAESVGAGEEEARQEEVVFKGTGKAIARALEVAAWFQQRGETYAVRMRTGTASSIDDVSYTRLPTSAGTGKGNAAGAGAEAGAQPETGEVDPEPEADPGPGAKPDVREERSGKAPRHSDGNETAEVGEEVEETRIRRLGVLEVYVSLR